jgi:alkaline phosphatase D
MKLRHLLLAWSVIPLLLSASPFLSHGPMVGRPGAHTMSVWARTSEPGRFVVHYGTNLDKLDQVSAEVRTDPEHDCTGWVELKPLQPDTIYYYRVAVMDGLPAKIPAGGRFRTFPDQDTLRDPALNPRGLFNFSFEAGTCADQGPRSAGPDATALKAAWQRYGDETLFAIQHGDWIYEDGRDYSADAWRKSTGASPRILELAPSLAGVWRNYQLYLERSAALAHWHRHIPNFAMYDDHEILNDIDGTGVPGYRSRPAVFRDIGVRAWEDYLGWANPASWPERIRFGRATLRAGNTQLEDLAADFSGLDLTSGNTLLVHWGLPSDGLFDGRLDLADGGVPNSRVYGVTGIIDQHHLRISPAPVADQTAAAYSIGARHYYDFRVGNCAYFVLDTRGHRGVSDLSGRRRDAPDVSMLGETQRAWLQTVMQRAATDPQVDFIFVVSSVNLMIAHTGKGGLTTATRPTDEAWPGFLRERNQLLDFWDTLGKPVLVLSGDLHNSFSARITERIWEFGCSPQGSGNHDLASESDRPVQGAYDSFGRPADIRWSTFFSNDVPQEMRRHPFFTRVRINNTFDNARQAGEPRAVAYPRPQAIVSFHDGFTGDLLYAETVLAVQK